MALDFKADPVVMVKVRAIRTLIVDNDQPAIRPGETVELPEAEANRLAALGAVALPAAEGEAGEEAAS